MHSTVPPPYQLNVLFAAIVIAILAAQLFVVPLALLRQFRAPRRPTPNAALTAE